MDYWKSKVLPKMRLIFVKAGGKKAAAATEIVKSFDESKEGINSEFQEKQVVLQPKVIEIYESVTAPVKVLIKERKKVSAIKKNSAAITKLFEDLAKIEFPGAKQVSEGIAKVGPALLSGPIFSTFEKVATLLPVVAEEQTPKEAPAATEEEKEEAAAAAEEKKDEAAVEEKNQEAAVEEKKEEADAEKKEEAPAAAEEAALAAVAAVEPAAEETSAAPAEAAPEAAAPAETTESAAATAEAEAEAPKAA